MLDLSKFSKEFDIIKDKLYIGAHKVAEAYQDSEVGETDPLNNTMNLLGLLWETDTG